MPLEPGGVGPLLERRRSVQDAEAEQSELLATLQEAIEEELTPHQRRVLVALALNGVPIDVLAERLGTTRGALYKTLHDARRKLRRHLDERGLSLDTRLEENLMERPDLRQALGRLLGPGGPEVGCDECFEELDRYVELELAGEDADGGDPRPARAPGRLPGVPGGAREPLRSSGRVPPSPPPPPPRPPPLPQGPNPPTSPPRPPTPLPRTPPLPPR